MSKNSLKLDQQLIKEARKFFDFSELFPNSKIDARYPLSKYQRGKIKSSIKTAENLAGGKNFLERDFIPMPRSKSRKKFTKETGLPSGFRGVLIPGGTKHNKKVHFMKGILQYERGEAGKLLRFIPLDAKSGRRFEISLRDKIKKYKSKYSFLALATYGGEIKGYYNEEGEKSAIAAIRKPYQKDDVELLINESVALYNRYAEMSSNRQQRANKKGMAAHPSEWGLGLLGD